MRVVHTSADRLVLEHQRRWATAFGVVCFCFGIGVLLFYPYRESARCDRAAGLCFIGEEAVSYERFEQVPIERLLGAVIYLRQAEGTESCRVELVGHDESRVPIFEEWDGCDRLAEVHGERFQAFLTNLDITEAMAVRDQSALFFPFSVTYILLGLALMVLAGTVLRVDFDRAQGIVRTESQRWFRPAAIGRTVPLATVLAGASDGPLALELMGGERWVLGPRLNSAAQRSASGHIAAFLTP